MKQADLELARANMDQDVNMAQANLDADALARKSRNLWINSWPTKLRVI